jgi:hypothetical protein
LAKRAKRAKRAGRARGKRGGLVANAPAVAKSTGLAKTSAASDAADSPAPKLRKIVLLSRTAPSPMYQRVCTIALKLPGVEESTSYGTPSLKVKGRIMCRLRTEAEGALALRCDFLDRQILLQADPGVFFVTDHYLNYPMVLVRLDRIRRGALPDLILRSWRMVAPPRLVAELDAAKQK